VNGVEQTLAGHPLRTLSAVTRAGTALAGAALCLAGGLIGTARPTVRLLLSMLCVALLVAFAQVVNDIVDEDLDRLTKPHRPLVSGAMSAASARALTAGLAVTGMAIAAALGPWFLAVAAAIAAASVAYSVRWKSTVLRGNAVVALLASTTIAFGAAANGQFGTAALAAQAAAFAFLFAFEVVKTGVDVDGDRTGGVRTIATVHGLVVTARIAVASLLAYVITAGVAAPLAEHRSLYLVLVAVGTGPLVVTAILRLVRETPTPASLRLALSALRFAWPGGALALLAL
jgi:geranylgeranylglycerol-phosphate geranylgeranyltransferase